MKKALIAGVVENVLEDMTKILQKRGCEVHIVQDPQQIVQTYQEINPDIFVLDVQMDKTSAGQIVKEFKERGLLNKTFILYSHFLKEAMAENSPVHFFYCNYLQKHFGEDAQYLRYIGIYRQDIFAKVVDLRLSGQI